ncbi:glycosyltransferase family 2 protein, partial [Candidatus Pelagibacter sp.]|nr:glycosyltransferase family 2 protein [Candidatus Pelagibacter sp.]
TEIIIIDDGSTDGTVEILNEKLSDKVKKIIYLEKNTGKGHAIKEGLKYANGEVIIIQDADLEYDPKDYEKLVSPFHENDADVVYGSRFIDNKKRRIIYFVHTVANKLLTFIVNCLLNLNFTDVETGYKAFKTEILKEISLKEKGFGFEIEVTFKLAKKNYKFYEVGVSYSGRSYEEGKKIQKKHFFEAIYCMFKYRFFK